MSCIYAINLIVIFRDDPGLIIDINIIKHFKVQILEQ